MAGPDSEMARLNARYAATIMKTIGDRIRRYQGEAASRPGLITGLETQREKNQAGECAPNPAEQNISEPELRPMEATNERAGAGSDRRAANWEDIEIIFLSDERVQIRNVSQTETRNYAEFGFADGRSKTPNQAWVTLRAMAQENGLIRDGSKTGRAWPKVEKRMQEIRKALRDHFDISADPLPFISGVGYQARFKIGCSPSFRT